MLPKLPLIHSLCECFESVEQPSTTAPRSLNSLSRRENSVISVGQMKVKSAG